MLGLLQSTKVEINLKAADDITNEIKELGQVAQMATLQVVSSMVKEQGLLANAMNEIPIIEEVLNVFKNYCQSELSISIFKGNYATIAL